MVRLTDRPDMTLDVYRGRKTTMQQQQQQQSIPTLCKHPIFQETQGRKCCFKLSPSFVVIQKQIICISFYPMGSR